MSSTEPTREKFRHLERLRVRWAEIDAQQIVFNGHYLMYFDTALAGYWRALALPYAETMAALGGDLFVRKATLEYHASAAYDDTLDIGVRCERIGTSSLHFSGAVFRQERLLVVCDLIYVFADPQARAAKPVPAPFRDLVTGFEAGETMLQLRVGSWDELGEDARRIRTEVFVAEQNIPVEMEWDDADVGAVHAVAINRLGMPLGTGRLLRHAPGVARIGRMAVRRVGRGGNVGRALLEALLAAARDRGDTQVMLHAQQSAVGFYRRAGFVAHGAPFDEAGIVHVEMVRAL